MIRGVWGVVVAAVLVALAGLVFALAPSEEQRQAPVEIPVELGQSGLGRNIEATINSIRVAEVVSTDSFEPWVSESEGVWVVVDATAASVVKSSLLNAWLTVDGLKYVASTRPDNERLDGTYLSPGIPVTGSIVFEVPRSVIESPDTVKISLATGSDVRLDSTIVVSARLDDLDVESDVVMLALEKGWQ